MRTPEAEFSSDDIFILGNLASLATRLGLGRHARSLWRLVQDVRPENAAGFLIEAMYLFTAGNVAAGIKLLEEAGALQAAVNRDEALAFHLYLLQQDGQLERAYVLGTSYLQEGLLRIEEALETVQIVVDECAAALGFGEPRQLSSGKGDLQ